MYYILFSFFCKASIFEYGNNGLELLWGVLYWSRAFLTIVEDMEGFICVIRSDVNVLVNSLYVVHAKAMGLKLWICVGSLFSCTSIALLCFPSVRNRVLQIASRKKYKKHIVEEESFEDVIAYIVCFKGFTFGEVF